MQIIPLTKPVSRKPTALVVGVCQINILCELNNTNIHISDFKAYSKAFRA